VGLVRWDDQSGLRLVIGLAGIALFGFMVATVGPGSYLRLPAVGGLVLSVLSVPLAVVPALRATSESSSRRALLTIGFWLAVAIIFIVVATATR
jgi:uncharacterized membrane protein